MCLCMYVCMCACLWAGDDIERARGGVRGCVHCCVCVEGGGGIYLVEYSYHA